MKFHIEIEDENGELRQIQLDHEYENLSEAESEAEDIADLEYTDSDVAWSLHKFVVVIE